MSNKVFAILVIILCVIGVGLGYAIYNMNSPSSPTVTDGQPSDSTGDGPVSTIIPNTTQSPTSSDSLQFPPEDASPEEQQKFQEAVRATAEKTDTLDITGCKPNPFALSLQTNTQLNVINNDETEHTIAHNAFSISVPAKSKKTVPANFSNGAGAYGYNCDGGASSVGILLVD